MWAPYVCGYQYPIYTAQVYAFAYHLTKNQLFLTTAEHFANLIERESPTSGCLKESWYKGYAAEYASHGTHADKYGRVITFFPHLFVLTKERRYLDSAQQTADEAIDKLFANYFEGIRLNLTTKQQITWGLCSMVYWNWIWC